MTDLDQYLDSDTILDELFRPLGNEVRIEILWILAEATEPLPFTTLQEELGIEDSGNFNYHINQLTDHFIRNTPNGYELRYPGRAIVRSIKQGGLTTNPELSPRSIDLPCPFCGHDQVFSYADETLQLRCSNCAGVVGEPYDAGTIMSYEFPAGGLRGRTNREAATAAHRLYDAEVTAMVGGVCPRCSGTVEGSLELCDEHTTDDAELCTACQRRYLAWANYTCRNCGFAREFPPWFKALYLPEVIAHFHNVADFTRELPFPKFLSEKGADLRDVTETVRSTDPVEVVIEMHLDEARCRIVVDADLEVRVEAKTIDSA